jgi:hypothetical protein
MANRIDFHPEHLALGWIDFKVLFAHLPSHIVREAWNKANQKTQKVSKKKD